MGRAQAARRVSNTKRGPSPTALPLSDSATGDRPGAAPVRLHAHNGIDPDRVYVRPARDAAVQFVVLAGKLPDEVLLLSHAFVAAAAPRRRGLKGADRRVRACQ